MNVPRFAHLAAQLLAREQPREPGRLGNRQQGVRAIEEGIRTLQRRDRWRKAGTIAAAVAAATGALWLNSELGGGPSEQLVDEATVQVSVTSHRGSVTLDDVELEDGADLSHGKWLHVAPEGSVGLELSSGTSIQLGGASVASILDKGKSQSPSTSRSPP
jgi:hypothetical protein